MHGAGSGQERDWKGIKGHSDIAKGETKTGTGAGVEPGRVQELAKKGTGTTSENKTCLKEGKGLEFDQGPRQV